jgi:single-strand DNA-binding protein
MTNSEIYDIIQNVKKRSDEKMAKENYVLLVGDLQGSPIMDQKKEKAKYVIRTFRRNDKIDYPIITILDAGLIEKMNTFKEGDYIIVKGILATDEVRKGAVCPECGEVVKSDGTTTEVIAIDHINIGPNYKLEDLKEISNTVLILGSLCKAPSFRLLPNSGIASAQYQLAVNRKYNVKKQEDTSDYPWVNSFGRQAEQDALRLDSGSQVFIQGGIQTRNVMKKVDCPKCGQEFTVEDFVAEIVPYSVEYLNNCKF